METIKLGPFKGMNTRLPDYALRVRDPGNSGDFVRDAVNVDVDNAGRFRSRCGQTLIAAMSDAHSLFVVSENSGFLVRDSVLYAITIAPYAESLLKILGSNSAVSYLVHDGIVYYSNGVDSGVLVSGVSYPIGLMTPERPSVSAVSGTLKKGRYAIGVTYTSSVTGRESGNAGTTLYELQSDGDLRVTLPPASPGATHVNVYVSDTNGAVAYLYETLAVGTATADITTTGATTRALYEAYEEPLPSGTNLFFHKGRLCCVKGRMLYYGNPFRLGYYTPTNFIEFENDITLAVAVDNGVYVAHGNKTQWLAGDLEKPEAVVNVFPYGAVPGTAFELPRTSTEKPSVGWFGEHGVVVADKVGQAVSVMADVVDVVPAVSSYSSVIDSFGYRRVLSCGWCMNLSSMAVTRYTNSDFTSSSGSFALKPDGLYSLSGNTDNGADIDWQICLGKHDFRAENLKALPAIYIGAASASPVVLTVATPDGTQYEYVARSCSETIEIHRIDPGKGLKENWYGLALKNEEGSFLTLASVSFAPALSGRRI